MFLNCECLKSIEIPSGVRYIGKKCFKNSGIEETTLPSTLEEVGDDVFEDCASLSTVWVEEDCTLDVGQYVSRSVEVRRK